MKATIKNEVIIRGSRFSKGDVIEVDENQFEKLQKAGCAELATVAEKVVSNVKAIGKKAGKVVTREINTGKATGRKIRKSGDK